jgi:hypothetical protein
MALATDGCKVSGLIKSWRIVVLATFLGFFGKMAESTVIVEKQLVLMN